MKGQLQIKIKFNVSTGARDPGGRGGGGQGGDPDGSWIKSGECLRSLKKATSVSLRTGHYAQHK